MSGRCDGCGDVGDVFCGNCLGEGAEVSRLRAEVARAREEGRREGIEAATNLLIGCWDDGDQGPPRSEIEQYAEIVLLRALADDERRKHAGGR